MPIVRRGKCSGRPAQDAQPKGRGCACQTSGRERLPGRLSLPIRQPVFNSSVQARRNVCRVGLGCRNPFGVSHG
jgi:hypothetical protein